MYLKNVFLETFLTSRLIYWSYSRTRCCFLILNHLVCKFNRYYLNWLFCFVVRGRGFLLLGPRPTDLFILVAAPLTRLTKTNVRRWCFQSALRARLRYQCLTLIVLDLNGCWSNVQPHNYWSEWYWSNGKHHQPPLQHLPVPVQGPIKALTRLFTNATPLAGQEIFLRGVRIEASRFPIDARVHPLSILSAKRGNEWDASELITVSNTVTESVPPGRRGGDEAEPVWSSLNKPRQIEHVNPAFRDLRSLPLIFFLVLVCSRCVRLISLHFRYEWNLQPLWQRSPRFLFIRWTGLHVCAKYLQVYCRCDWDESELI